MDRRAQAFRLLRPLLLRGVALVPSAAWPTTITTGPTDYYFGNVRTSHGCMGMRYDDARFFWEFATIGTRVVVF